MTDSEIELVKRAKKGDREAFENLFLMEKEYLYKTAFMYMKNKDDALDLVQNCILKCMVSIKDLKRPEFFRTWMTRIMINCASSEWTKRRKYDLSEDEDIYSESSIAVSPEEKLDLYHAIDLLKYPYRAIIVQHYFAGNKLTEIARILDMPLGTVKMYHSKAKLRLKEILEVEA